MPYLVDGHNLIPKLGLRLEDLEDEQDLIFRLQEFCRLRRRQVEVFFDGAPHGQPSTRKLGTLTVHFVRKESSADAAIEIRLNKLGKAARNWTVVSSDGRVRLAAASAHAEVLSSEEFTEEMRRAQSSENTKGKNETTLPPNEVAEWLDIFTNKKN